MRLLTILFILHFGVFSFAQIYERYPPGQNAYVGGNSYYYNDFHQIVVEKNLKPCENKEEAYYFKVVVYPDSTIKYVKDEDTISVAQNKCAFDLAREVAKYQKGWIPAKINGENVAAAIEFLIYPDDLFENYKDGYDPYKLTTLPEFEGGLNEFRRLVANRIDISRFRANKKFRLEVIFIVNAQGKIENVKLVESTANEDFNRNVIYSIQSIKKQWKPATLRGTPVKYRFRLPLVFNFE